MPIYCDAIEDLNSLPGTPPKIIRIYAQDKFTTPISDVSAHVGDVNVPGYNKVNALATNRIIAPGLVHGNGWTSGSPGYMCTQALPHADKRFVINIKSLGDAIHQAGQVLIHFNSNTDAPTTGLLLFVWPNGGGSNGITFPIYDRTTGSWVQFDNVTLPTGYHNDTDYELVITVIGTKVTITWNGAAVYTDYDLAAHYDPDNCDFWGFGVNQFFEYSGDADGIFLDEVTVYGIIAGTDPYSSHDFAFIGGVDTCAKSMALKAHRQAGQQENACALYYWRDNQWNFFPTQPVMDDVTHPTITRAWRQPATLQCAIPDPFGLLTPENEESPYNYNSVGELDPIIDNERKILLRVGTWCYANLFIGQTPTSSLAPSTGDLGDLGDSTYGDITDGVTNFVQFNAPDTTPIVLQWDLGSVLPIQHVGLRVATKVDTCQLPASWQLLVSVDNETWHEFLARPMGGDAGDWDEDYDGRNISSFKTDVEQEAQYVKIVIVPQSAGMIFIDEIVCYGGNQQTLIGYDIFCGYFGDAIDIDDLGNISFTAQDVLTKLGDNNSNRVTTRFQMADIADILWTMLTGGAYWHGTAGSYDGAVNPADVGWPNGANYTNFPMPTWQGQNNNILGYASELTNEIGWELYAIGGGQYCLRHPAWSQLLPDRVLISGRDGNNDVRGCKRHRTKKDMRNVIEVTCGDPNSGANRTVVEHPLSIRRWFRSIMGIVDPLATTADLRAKIGQKVLRDYAFRVQNVTNVIRTDHTTIPRMVAGFRAPARPYLWPKDSRTFGRRHAQELWYLVSYDEHIQLHEIYAEADWVPYMADGPQIPINVAVNAGSGGGVTSVVVTWSAPTVTVGGVTSPDTTITRINFYLSTVSDTSGFPSTPNDYEVNVTGGTHTITGLINGQQYYLYAQYVGRNGVESMPSTVIPFAVGLVSGSTSDWAITDLDGMLNQYIAPTTVYGYHTYEFYLFWTSPPIARTLPDDGHYGTKQIEIRYALDAIPTVSDDPNSWTRIDEWHGDRVPPGKQWDRVNDGYLWWYVRIPFTAALAPGRDIYLKMWTWDTTNGRHCVPIPSNILHLVTT